MNALRIQKNKLLRDALNPSIVPSKVPVAMCFNTPWVCRNAGYGLSEAVYDPYKVFSACHKTAFEFDVDIFHSYGAYACLYISKILGSSDCFVDDETYSFNFKDINYIDSPEDYKELIKDPKAFLWNNLYAKKFSNLSEASLSKTLGKFYEMNEIHAKLDSELYDEVVDKKGVIVIGNEVPFYQPAFDYLFQYIRGIKGISLDMRRCPELLADAVCAFESINAPFTEVNDTDFYPLQGNIEILGHNFTNQKQFERFIWPDAKKRLNLYNKHNYKYYLRVQGTSERIFPYLGEIPDGECLFDFELDAPENVIGHFGKKFTYMTGIPLVMLGSSTKEECIAFTEKFLETYAHAGNIVFATDKMITFKNDAQPENIKSVIETVNNFRP